MVKVGGGIAHGPGRIHRGRPRRGHSCFCYRPPHAEETPAAPAMTTPKNTICLWYDGTALEAAQCYAATFPDSAAIEAARRG